MASDTSSFLRTVLLLSTSLVLPACGTDVTQGETAGGSSGPLSCEQYTAVPTGTAATVRLVNSRSAPIYLSDNAAGCGPLRVFSIRDASGTELQWAREICTLTCETLQQNTCACAADCAVPPIIQIAPGGAYEVDWSGTVFTEVDMPAACFKDPSCAPRCLFEEAPASGDLTLNASAWTDHTASCSPNPCTCTPDANGSCQFPGPGSGSGMELTATATLTYPGKVVVVLTF